MAKLGCKVSKPTLSRLLKELGYSLQSNHKEYEASAAHPDRNLQFEYLESLKYDFRQAGWPIISVDTKKKELIGNFYQAGQTWQQAPEYVNVHDFSQEAVGKAVPYGIYDLSRNRGRVYVGQSADTAEFAVEAIGRWWEEEGQHHYPEARQLLILADGGGSNGYRVRLWKQQLQTRLCDRYGLTVTVCHYPPGCSKWNPIEHRLFGPISCNWASVPLRTWETIVGCIRGTSNDGGLEVEADLLEGEYARGRKVSDAEMKTLCLERHSVCPNWNYTLLPRLFYQQSFSFTVNREVVL